MIYFKNVPQYGDLEIEKVLFLFDNIPLFTGTIRKDIFCVSV